MKLITGKQVIGKINQLIINQQIIYYYAVYLIYLPRFCRHSVFRYCIAIVCFVHQCVFVEFYWQNCFISVTCTRYLLHKILNAC